eukprot:6197362-Pleurochrysis_carterae.AAC.1
MDRSHRTAGGNGRVPQCIHTRRERGHEETSTGGAAEGGRGDGGKRHGGRKGRPEGRGSQQCSTAVRKCQRHDDQCGYQQVRVWVHNTLGGRAQMGTH